MIIKSIENRLKDLDEEDLLKIDGFINQISHAKIKNAGIDKKALRELLKLNGFDNLKQFVKILAKSDFGKNPNSGYIPRPFVVEFISFELECSKIQAEALIKLMVISGYVDVSSYDNISFSKSIFD
jgi:hypothetical protein